jgi:hypothetical protein
VTLRPQARRPQCHVLHRQSRVSVHSSQSRYLVVAPCCRGPASKGGACRGITSSLLLTLAPPTLTSSPARPPARELREPKTASIHLSLHKLHHHLALAAARHSPAFNGEIKGSICIHTLVHLRKPPTQSLGARSRQYFRQERDQLLLSCLAVGLVHGRRIPDSQYLLPDAIVYLL